MKKLLSFFMVGILLLTMSLIPLEAVTSTNSLVSYGDGSEIRGACKGKSVNLGDGLSGLMMSTSSELVLLGNDDFKIEIGNPAKEFEVISDVDNDGYKDVAVYMECDDDYDDFKIISSKTSKVLYATKFSYKTVNNDNEAVSKNAVVRQIAENDQIIYLIYNYHLLAINTKDYKVLFDYEAKDNIWKMAIVDDQIFFTTQLGELGCLDKQSGALNYLVKLTAPIEVKNDNYNTSSKVAINSWDILAVQDKLYVTSEDAKLHEVNVKTGEVVRSISLDDEVGKILDKCLKRNNNWSGGDIVSTGIHNNNFMSYQISMIDDGLMLVKAYLGHPQIELENVDEEKQTPHLIVIDLKKLEIKLNIAIDQYNLDSSNVVKGEYNNQNALIIPTYTATGKLRVVAYSLDDGTVLKQSNLNISGLAKDKVKVEFANYGDYYLLQIDGGTAMFINKDLKIAEYLGNANVVNKITDVSDGTIVSVKNNGKAVQLKKLGLNGKDDLLAVFDVAVNYRNNGFEAVKYDEKYNHLLSLVNETNESGEIIASHIVIMSVSDGKLLVDKKVLLEKGHDENNKYFEHYLIGEEIEYFSDLNNDGKPEILVGDNLIDGAALVFKSIYNQTFEGADSVIAIGDLNNDGITDLVNVGESEMRLYYSVKNGYEVTYQKTNIVKSYDKKLQNNVYVKELGDLDHDGIKDFVINAYNEKGCQYYQVINAKDLSVRYSLLKNGVIYEDSEDSFEIAHIDYNNDGVDDLVYGIYDEKRTVLNGATGEKLFDYVRVDYHNDWSRDYGEAVPKESLVALNLIENEREVIKVADLNNDSIGELAYLVADHGSMRSEHILKILDGQSYKEIKSTVLGKAGYTETELININGQTKLIYNDGTLSQIYDYSKGNLVAGLKTPIISAKALNNGNIQIEDDQGQLYSFSDQRDFELVDFNSKEINNGTLKINYQTDKNGLMYVYDQGNLIEKTTAKSFKVKLLEGKHDLIFSYNDGHGKTTHYETTVIVEKSAISRYLLILLAMLIIAGGMGLVFYPKYRLMKKAGVKRG